MRMVFGFILIIQHSNHMNIRGSIQVGKNGKWKAHKEENHTKMGKTIFQKIRTRYPENEYALMCEVSNEAGFKRTNSADFILMNLWESRGLAITGMERKSNRSDWLKELKSPKKGEAFFKFCDYWYLITDKPGIALLQEIPETWGWLDASGENIKVMKQAPKNNNVQPLTRGFISCMLRRAVSKEGYIHKDDIEERIEAEAERKAGWRETEAKNIKERFIKLQIEVREFESASGIRISDRWDLTPQKIGHTLRGIIANEEDVKDQIRELSNTYKQRLSALYDLLESFPLPKLIIPKHESTEQRTKATDEGTAGGEIPAKDE